MSTRKTFLLRMAPELYAELEAWAQQELRSVNGQIEFALHEAVKRRRGERAEVDDPAQQVEPGSQSPAASRPGERARRQRKK